MQKVSLEGVSGKGSKSLARPGASIGIGAVTTITKRAPQIASALVGIPREIVVSAFV